MMNVQESNSFISEHKEANAGKVQYKAYADENSCGILVYNSKGELIDANNEACSMLGYLRAELLKKNIAEVDVGLVIPTDKKWSDFPGTTQVILQRNFRKRDGTNLPVEVHYRCLEKDGETLFECLLKDVSERNLLRIREHHRAEILEQLAGDADLPDIMRSIVKSIEEEDITSICTILLYDKQTNTLGNGIGPGMPDFYNEEINGISVGDGIGSCGTAAFLKKLVVVEDIRTHPYWTAFKDLAIKAGVHSCWSQPILSANDEMVGTFAIYHREPRIPGETDLGRIAYGARFIKLAIENRRNRAEILEHKNHLEKLVARRTQDLTAANEELEAFSYSVSHDLRAPLRAITGFSNIMLEDYGDKLDEQGKKTLYTIIDNALRMGTLIEDILSFSKLSRAEKRNMILDMGAIFRTVFEDLMKQEASERKVVFDLNELSPSTGDHAMIVQVVTNLLSNALKYSRNTNVTMITVSSEIRDQEVVYSVKDNGAGFNEKYRDKLFKIFSRLHNDNEFEGTGIGLSIVKKVIERHGGVVSASGELGKGAIFSFSLPGAYLFNAINVYDDHKH